MLVVKIHLCMFRCDSWSASGRCCLISDSEIWCNQWCLSYVELLSFWVVDGQILSDCTDLYQRVDHVLKLTKSLAMSTLSAYVIKVTVL
jgi:hypothetical protein